MKELFLKVVVVIVFGLGIFSSISLSNLAQQSSHNNNLTEQISDSTTIVEEVKFMPDVVLMKQLIHSAQKVYKVTTRF